MLGGVDCFALVMEADERVASAQFYQKFESETFHISAAAALPLRELVLLVPSQFATLLVYCEATRSRQQLYAPSPLLLGLLVISFSVRAHPAPFSPTPYRHARIKLKMKGGGPGARRPGQGSLAFLVPGSEVGCALYSGETVHYSL